MTNGPQSDQVDSNLFPEQPVFFCGIGGSGMLPLAQILAGMGAQVAGSDRSHDQGRTPDKFAWIERNGMTLFPQDGSGLVTKEQILVASAAIEDSVPEIARASALGCKRMTRAEALAELFNAAGYSMAVGGTSGKSTVTGMVGTIFAKCGYDPTIMNGAIMKNFVSADNPFASARVGRREVFVSEVDESDGSIALFRPTIGVLLNVSLDHKSMDELRELFGNFVATAGCAVVNFDDQEARALAQATNQLVSFAIDAQDADMTVDLSSINEGPTSISALVKYTPTGETQQLDLPVPGRHNLSNALAALATASAAGIELARSAPALNQFEGLARRFDIVGESPTGIHVIDDFGHNPEKCAATLRTLKAHAGRVIAFFQPHGYGPLRQMGTELAETFATELDDNDHTIMCDPVYFGGTVDRSEGTERIVGLIAQAGGKAEHIADRAACGDRIVHVAEPGDRIVIMGARDDTLSDFARSILARLP